MIQVLKLTLSISDKLLYCTGCFENLDIALASFNTRTTKIKQIYTI